MIAGIGVDVMCIDRMAAQMENERLLRKVFKEGELAYIQSKRNAAQTAAGIFCAKEALLKAMGKGIGAVAFHDIEISHKESGAPFLTVKDVNMNFHVSISHDENTAVAFVVAEPR